MENQAIQDTPMTAESGDRQGGGHRPATQPSPADIDRWVEDLNRDGICILRNVLDAGKVEAWAQAFHELFEQRWNQPGGLAPREQARYYLTLPWRAPFADADIFANPVVTRVLDRVFPQEYVLVQMGADVPLQGSDYQETHRDFRPLFSEDVVTPLYAVAVNFPLVDVTTENGPFEMARGTHVLPRDVGLQKVASGEMRMEQFLLNKGDMMIRTPLALHRGTPNLTDQPRPMIVMGYVMHWLHTPKVDVTLPQAYYDSLPGSVQKMLRCNVVDQLVDGRAETYTEFKY
jgi:ectoine hydroxylase-related dioxygenase (phytanoyl-CoA dioxygenase family)